VAATPGERRTPGRRPGRNGPGGRGGVARPARKRAHRERVAAVAQARAEERQRSRLTGRAAILVLVLAVLAVSYASSLRAYLQQRHQIDTLEAEIERTQGAIDELQREKERWEDPAYVAQQARERFNYVAPGETPYVVVDENGEPLTDAELGDPSSVGEQDTRAWYDGLWDSVQVAGDPPTKIPAPPEKRIDGTEDE